LIEGVAEEGRRYVETDFNRVIEIKEREKYRVGLFMEAIDQRQKTPRRRNTRSRFVT
jgi:type I restriction enzyme, R subunit